MELLKVSYEYCKQQAVTLQINFGMMRGKPEFGGVPSSLHPGKIVIQNVFAHSESEARETLRAALLNLFAVNKLIIHDANKLCEKWIDVKRSNTSVYRRDGDIFQEYTV